MTSARGKLLLNAGGASDSLFVAPDGCADPSVPAKCHFMCAAGAHEGGWRCRHRQKAAPGHRLADPCQDALRLAWYAASTTAAVSWSR